MLVEGAPDHSKPNESLTMLCESFLVIGAYPRDTFTGKVYLITAKVIATF